MSSRMREPDPHPVPPGPASSALAARLAAVESRNVTFLGPDFPVFWTEARGTRVRDADGHSYLDMTGAFGVAVAGHCHPRVVRAIQEQAGRLVHGMGDVHPPAIKVELLERLATLAPWDEARGVLASSGSEAVEIALKTAMLATDRPGVLAFRGGYHGLTLGALSTTARADFREPFRKRIPAGVRFVPFPDVLESGPDGGAASLEAVDRELNRATRGRRPIGAVIVEPIQGRGGVRVPPPGFLRDLAALARTHGALLVFDEIFTGMGRTGRMLASDAEGVAPDLVCMGKALGGGLPLSACLGPPDVMDAWPPSRGEALHTSTFLGHPLACAASLALLDVLRDEDLPARAARVGTLLAEALADAVHDVPGVRGVRGRGLFLGLVLGGEGWPDGVGGAEVAVAALRRGLLVLPAGDRGEVVELTPPLTLGEDEVAEAVEALAGAAWEAAGGDPGALPEPSPVS